MRLTATGWDGFHTGLGLVFMILKVWLVGALCLTLASITANGGTLLALAAGSVTVAAVLPFIRLRWAVGLRSGLRGAEAAEFRRGLLVSLIVAMAALWAGMVLFTVVASGAAVGEPATIPSGLNAVAGGLVVVASLIGAGALARLQVQRA
jgi:hypothetical protein